MKKVLCLSLAVLMVMSVFAFSFSAAQTKVSSTGDVDKSKSLTYDNTETKWEGPVQFFVYDPDGEEIIPWGSKKLNGVDNGDGTWSYDPAEHGMELDPAKEYCVIFHDLNTGSQTYDLVFDTSSLGDTAKPTGMYTENPVDSAMTAIEVVWESGKFGSRQQVTSIGNVVGSYCPKNTSPYEMFTDLLRDKLENARFFSGKDDQTLLDDTAKALGLSSYDVETAIHDVGVTTAWSKDLSTISADDDDSSAAGESSGSSDAGSSSSGSESIPSATRDQSYRSTKDTAPRSGSGSGSGDGSGSATSPKTGYNAELYLVVLLSLFAVICAGVSTYKLFKKHD